jgi:hypothetical protein
MTNNEEVTIYYEMFMGIQFGMIEAKLIDHGLSEHLLSRGAPFVTFLPPGKRKPRKVTGEKGSSYIVILRGTGYPDPPAPFVMQGGTDTGRMSGLAYASGGSDCKRIYAFDDDSHIAYDPRFRVAFDRFINGFTDRIIADYRGAPLPSTEAALRPSNETASDDDSETDVGPANREPTQHSSFDPSALEDERRRSLAERVLRPGQAKFREAVLSAYGRRCAITGCNILEALEAAHIIPYCGPDSDHVTNGLLLRLDLHSLFDAGLLAVHPETLVVELEASVSGGYYSIIEGRRLRVPRDAAHRPNPQALVTRYQDFLSRKQE